MTGSLSLYQKFLHCREAHSSHHAAYGLAHADLATAAAPVHQSRDSPRAGPPAVHRIHGPRTVVERRHPGIVTDSTRSTGPVLRG
jgi:hypothetical protein